ncbi:OPA3-like protein [Pseudocercospora fuligena]|uniref:OPA3-like protein n=1 Tax=Pseudocercospora fuligena TaxID=685502 RepID=A0A8H6VN79_9PEZI|nr:OPA3-like protein [Pseudocercospora fuligena]
MSSLTLKLVSLAVRTAAKPIGNYIKRQAKEHEGFRRFAVGAAQGVHRLDMRMRLGLLHDPEAQQRMHEREKRAAEEKKRREEMPTVRSEEEQKKYDEQKAQEEADEAAGKKKTEEKPHRPKIRPLTEARAIELGANFFSEAFIFGVAVGLLLFENWRSRSKASARRDEVSERLEQLEAEVESLRAKLDPDLETLHDLSERAKEAKKRRQSWSGWVASGFGLTGQSAEDSAIKEEEKKPAKAETNNANDYTKVKVHGEEQLIAPRRKSIDVETEGTAKDKSKQEGAKKEQHDDKAAAPAPACVDSVQAGTKGRRLQAFTAHLSAAMFCHTLRRRPSFKPILKSLGDDPALRLLESGLDTHDLTLPLHCGLDAATGTTRSTRHLRVLLLSPSSVSDKTEVEATLERIQRFSSLSVEPTAIIFLLKAAHTMTSRSEEETNTAPQDGSEGALAYSTLQAELLEHAFPTIPILLLPELGGLPDLLKQHVTILNQSAIRSPNDRNATLDLLGVCANAMGNPGAVHYLHDTFRSLPQIAETCINTTSLNSSSPTNIAAFAQQVLSQADLFDGDQMQTDFDTSTPEGRMMAIKNLAGEEQAAALLDFWKAEWSIDE